MSAQFSRLVAMILMFATTAGVSAVTQDRKPAPAAPVGETGQLIQGRKLIDHDYKFRIDMPAGWRVLGEKRMQQISEDAVAGALKTRGGGGGCVIVERLGKVDLAELTDLVLDGLSLEDMEVLERGKARVSGCDAVRFRVSGRTGGVATHYLFHVVQRGEWIYQVLSWSMAARVGDGEVLETLCRGFSLVEGRPRRRTTHVAVADQHGVGWRIRGGVFESAACRFRAAAAEGWRPIVGERLAAVNTDAEFGMTHPATESYLAVLVEAAPADREAAFHEHAREDLVERAGGAVKEAGTFEVGGVKRQFVATESSGGFHARFLQATWMEGGFFYRVMTWHPVQDRKKAMKALPAALACIRVLTPADAGRIGKEIRALPDPEADVGLHYSLRCGVYRNYAFGIEWEKPARGWWSVAAGQQARERVEGAEAGLGESVKFSAVEKSSGVLCGMSLERHAGSDARAYHREVVGAINAALDDATATAAPEVDIYGISAQVTVVDGCAQTLDLRYHVATFVGDGIAGRLVIWGVKGQVEAGAAAVKDALAGWRYLGTLKPFEVVDGRFVDHRMGWSLPVASSRTRPVEMASPSARPRCTVRMFGEEDAVAIVIAVDPGPQGFARGALEKVMLESMINTRLGPIDFSDAKPFEGKLAGRKARCRRKPVGEQVCEIRMLTVRNTAYVLLTAGKKDDGFELAGEFRVLDR